MAVALPSVVYAQPSYWVWGNNSAGQLGVGNNTSVNQPLQPQGNSWVSVAAGYMHSVGIVADGTLWAWGKNDTYQLGDATGNDRNLPLRIYSANGVAGRWTHVAAGYWHSAGIRANGSLWTWGLNTSGQLGDGSFVGWRNLPTRVDNAATGKWIAITCGYYHNAAIKEDGSLWAWGGNSNGELGTGDIVSGASSPILVDDGSAGKWVAVSAGRFFTIGIKENGSLWLWGRNGVGTPYRTPTLLDDGSRGKWQQVSAGQTHCVGIREDGSLWGWGSSNYGQTAGAASLTPALINDGFCMPWMAAAAGEDCSLAVKKDGTVWAFGLNTEGQLGDGSNTNKLTPTIISRLNYVQNPILEVGGSHVLLMATQTANPLFQKAIKDTLIQACIVKGNAFYMNEKRYASNGIYYDTIVTPQGCDSAITLQLSVIDTITIFRTITGCDSVFFNNQKFTQPTIITDTVKSWQGCDSIYTTIFIQVSHSSQTFADTCLPAGAQYFFNNQWIQKSGQYSAPFLSVDKCDSTVELNITIAENRSFKLEGVDSILHNNMVYSSSVLVKDTIKNSAGCDSIYNVYDITITSNGPLKIPNAFSPNGDGINDVWVIGNSNQYPDIRVKIFDRYGQLTYENLGYNKPWDGTKNNRLMPAGVYYYLIELSERWQAKPLTGAVLLLR